MALALVLFPVGMAGLIFVLPIGRLRPWLLPLAALGQLGLAALALSADDVRGLDGWLVLDPLGKVFLGLVALLFFLCSWYTAGYLSRSDKPQRVFCACLLLSLGMMTLVILSHHLGLMWVAMEASTLVLAPAIYFHHDSRSLEATWKYLMICSVGIALALLGSFFLAYATVQAGVESTLLFDDLVGRASLLSRPWLLAAFVLLLVGYGTKMGLAPMHTWLPDAHGEAPAPVSALLSGAMLPCAFLAILRIFHIGQAAGQGEALRPLLVGMGLFSMAVGAVFMVRQRDLKRLLAYSSVEHMGILVLGAGIGGLALFAALLHTLNNGLTKVALFLSAGNIQAAYGTKQSQEVQGVARRLPLTGPLFLAGFLAITGSPPFGPFVSEFTLLSGTLAEGHYWVGGLFVALLFLVFLGMGTTVVSVVLGQPTERANGTPFHDGLLLGLPILTSIALVLLLGLYLPPPLTELLRDAAAFLEAGR